MRLTVLFFAQARERAGCASAPLELPEGSSIEDAIFAISRDHPTLASLWPHLAIALDGELVRGPVPLRDGGELALLPPVSGG
jgi:molybdopterin synthase catalytic subunit